MTDVLLSSEEVRERQRAEVVEEIYKMIGEGESTFAIMGKMQLKYPSVPVRTLRLWRAACLKQISMSEERAARKRPGWLGTQIMRAEMLFNKAIHKGDLQRGLEIHKELSLLYGIKTVKEGTRVQVNTNLVNVPHRAISHMSDQELLEQMGGQLPIQMSVRDADKILYVKPEPQQEDDTPRVGECAD